MAVHVVRRLAILAAAALAGCGSAPKRPPPAPVDNATPRALFVSAGCGGCHHLADARTKGATGPNFDTSERLDRAQLLQGMVEGANGMPSFERKLTPAQRGMLADYLLRVAWRRTPGR